MLWVIALLVAAILITLLGAWRVIPGILAVIVGLVLWIALAVVAGTAFGNSALWLVLGLPFIVLFVFGMHQVASGKTDLWGKPIDKPIDHNFLGRHDDKNQG